MEIIKNILKDYWQPILAAVIFILSFILQLIKKKNVTSIDEDIFLMTIKGVCFAEEGDFKGKEKKDAVVTYVLNQLHSRYPDLDVGQYANYISTVIELILSTPQKKKGGNTDGEKKTNG